MLILIAQIQMTMTFIGLGIFYMDMNLTIYRYSIFLYEEFYFDMLFLSFYLISWL